MAKHERVGNTNIWWFPKSFSQSCYGKFKNSGTNSCTIISLIVADKISKCSEGLNKASTILSRNAINLFCEAINTGNRLYNQEITSKVHSKSKNLNIPDATRIIHTEPDLKFQLNEWFYVQLCTDPNQSNYTTAVVQRLLRLMKLTIRLYLKINKKDKDEVAAKNLFAAIIADRRTVIMSLELSNGVAAIFDSHRHGLSAGAIFAQAPLKHLNELLLWFINMLKEVYNSKPKIIEISFLTPKKNIGW